MKGLSLLAVRLYPSWWRQRYAREFEALLEAVQPGWRGLFDVINGALTMHLKTLDTIPVVCALAGAIAGGIIALPTPEVFASSATIHMKGPHTANAGSAPAQLRVSLEKALGASSGTRRSRRRSASAAQEERLGFRAPVPPLVGLRAGDVRNDEG